MCLSDECGPQGRRAFLAAALAASLVPQGLLAAGRAEAESGDVQFSTSVGPVRGYLASPSAGGRHPAVLVAHGVVGLPDWVRAVADELAASGFAALAVSRFSRDPDVTADRLRQEGRTSRHLTETSFLEQQQELLGAIAFLRSRRFVRPGRIAAVGFCGGGIQAVRLSLAAPALRAVVSFYGPPALPPQYKHPTDPIRDLTEIAGKVRTPLQIHYGTADYAVPGEAVDRLAAGVRAAGTPVEVHAYEGATHAFYDSRTPPPNEAAAGLARDRYLKFLHARLD
jgi:carboxymethylenebutenolidase